MGVPGGWVFSHERGTPVALLPLEQRPDRALILYSKGIELELFGNEVDYTACSLLVMLENSRCKLHCQKGLNLIPFSYKIGS